MSLPGEILYAYVLIVIGVAIATGAIWIAGCP